MIEEEERGSEAEETSAAAVRAAQKCRKRTKVALFGPKGVSSVQIVVQKIGAESPRIGSVSLSLKGL